MRIIIEDDNVEIKYKDKTIFCNKAEELAEIKEESDLNKPLPDIFNGKIMINNKEHYDMIKDVVLPPFILIIETLNHRRKMITTDGISKYEDLSRSTKIDMVECFVEEMEYGVVVKTYKMFMFETTINLIKECNLFKRYKITVLGDEEK